LVGFQGQKEMYFVAQILSTILSLLTLALAAVPAAVPVDEAQSSSKPWALYPDSFRHYFDAFNANDEELHATHISNAESYAFLKNNIPLIDIPDKRMEQTYYFRWWTFRKHIKHSLSRINLSFSRLDFTPYSTRA
jgi:hypothetical protein